MQQSKWQLGSITPLLATPVWAGTEGPVGLQLHRFLKREKIKTITITITFDSVYIT